jgi:hypothetical protein
VATSEHFNSLNNQTASGDRDGGNHIPRGEESGSTGAAALLVSINVIFVDQRNELGHNESLIVEELEDSVFLVVGLGIGHFLSESGGISGTVSHSGSKELSDTVSFIRGGGKTRASADSVVNIGIGKPIRVFDFVDEMALVGVEESRRVLGFASIGGDDGVSGDSEDDEGKNDTVPSSWAPRPPHPPRPRRPQWGTGASS